MVYVNDKTILLVCDNTVYAKIIEKVSEKNQKLSLHI
jgi:ribosomal protein S17